MSQIFRSLAPGGWYVNIDPVSTEDDLVKAAWRRVSDRQQPKSAQKRLGRTPQEQARHENHVRYMAPLQRQLNFLCSDGFEAVDVYWKQLDYVIYGGNRPPAKSGR